MGFVYQVTFIGSSYIRVTAYLLYGSVSYYHAYIRLCRYSTGTFINAPAQIGPGGDGCKTRDYRFVTTAIRSKYNGFARRAASAYHDCAVKRFTAFEQYRITGLQGAKNSIQLID